MLFLFCLQMISDSSTDQHTSPINLCFSSILINVVTKFKRYWCPVVLLTRVRIVSPSYRNESHRKSKYNTSLLVYNSSVLESIVNVPHDFKWFGRLSVSLKSLVGAT